MIFSKNITSYFSLLTYFTYYLSEGCQAELTSIFFLRIALIYHFTGFPYLLTTFSKDVRLSGTQIFVRISLSLLQIGVLTLKMTSGRGHPLEY